MTTDYSRFKNIPQVLAEAAQKYPSHSALQWVEDGKICLKSYTEFERLVHEMAVGLSVEVPFGASGPQDFVSIHAQYGAEIFPIYWSVLANRGIFAGIQDAQDMLKALSELKPKVVALQNPDYLARFAAVYDALPVKPVRVILLKGEPPAGVSVPGLLTAAALCAKGREALAKKPGAYEELTARLRPSDAATLTSTSGTTGEPKFFLFSHQGQIKAAEALVRAFQKHFPLTENTGLLNGAFPSDDIFSFFTLLIAAEGYRAHFFTSRDWAVVFESLQIKGPDLWFMTPQVVYGINRGFQHQLNLRLGEAVTKFLYKFASDVGYKYFESTVVGNRKFGLMDKAFHKMLDKIIYKVLRDFLGGSFYGVVIGSQKLDHRALGIMGGGHAFIIKQNYGTREVGTIGFGINNVYSFDEGVDYKLVTEKSGVLDRDAIAKAGRPVDGVLKVKTPGMAIGYYPATKPMFDEQGFFDTGDLVRIHPGLRLEFLGRHKYWIYDNNAETKFNPEDVEGLIKVVNGVQNCVILSRFEHVGKFTPENPGTNMSIVGVLGSDLPYEKLLPYVVDVNKKLPRLHKLAGFIVTPAKDWEAGKGLVTETMKARRGPIADAYEQQLDELYKAIDKNGGKPLIALE